jgi:hypothetical protein
MQESAPSPKYLNHPNMPFAVASNTSCYTVTIEGVNAALTLRNCVPAKRGEDRDLFWPGNS